LDSSQRSEVQQIYGNFLDHPEFGLKSLIQSDVYQQAPDALRKQIYEGRLLDAKKTAEDLMMTKHPELRIKEIQNEAAQYLPMLENNPVQQQRAAEQYSAEINKIQNMTPEEQQNIMRFTIPGGDEQ
jgi:hypothetical protein